MNILLLQTSQLRMRTLASHLFYEYIFYTYTRSGEESTKRDMVHNTKSLFLASLVQLSAFTGSWQPALGALPELFEGAPQAPTLAIR